MNDASLRNENTIPETMEPLVRREISLKIEPQFFMVLFLRVLH